MIQDNIVPFVFKGFKIIRIYDKCQFLIPYFNLIRKTTESEILHYLCADIWSLLTFNFHEILRNLNHI